MPESDPNALLDDGETPLHHAARQYDDGAAVSALLARGADARRLDRAGRNALWAAVQGDEATVMPLLAQAGADPNQPDAQGALLLPTVVGWRNPRAARALVAAGADPQRPQRDGTTALGLALARGDALVLGAMLGEERARELLASRIEAPVLQARRAAVLAALRAGATAYRSNHEGWEELSWSPREGRFMLASGGEGGSSTGPLGDDARALAYLYEQDIRQFARELDLWDDLLRRWNR